MSPEHLLFAPGNGWAYSNIGYLLLRRLIEQTCGTNLQTVLQRLIFAPLSMRSCRLAQSEEDMTGLALPPPDRYHPAWAFHGCVIGPVDEAALALHQMLGNDLLAPESRTALLDPAAVGGALAGRPCRNAATAWA